jgi:hypothetical protein
VEEVGLKVRLPYAVLEKTRRWVREFFSQVRKRLGSALDVDHMLRSRSIIALSDVGLLYLKPLFSILCP